MRQTIRLIIQFTVGQRPIRVLECDLLRLSGSTSFEQFMQAAGRQRHLPAPINKNLLAFAVRQQINALQFTVRLCERARQQQDKMPGNSLGGDGIE